MKYIKGMLILIFIFNVSGCGKKVWPEPDASLEKFSISITHQQMQADCLEIHAEVSGNHRNLASIVLELEISEEPCPACPFIVSTSIPMDPGSPEAVLLQNQLSIVHCGLDPDKYYRARLRAGNVHPVIRDVMSGVVIIEQ
jgi:hypothetical protein